MWVIEIYLSLFWDPCWLWTQCVTENNLELLIFLSLSPQCQASKHVPPYSTFTFFSQIKNIFSFLPPSFLCLSVFSFLASVLCPSLLPQCLLLFCSKIFVFVSLTFPPFLAWALPVRYHLFPGLLYGCFKFSLHRSISSSPLFLLNALPFHLHHFWQPYLIFEAWVLVSNGFLWKWI